MLEKDHCLEEETQLKMEQDTLQEWFVEEWTITKWAVEATSEFQLIFSTSSR